MTSKCWHCGLEYDLSKSADSLFCSPTCSDAYVPPRRKPKKKPRRKPKPQKKRQPAAFEPAGPPTVQGYRLDDLVGPEHRNERGDLTPEGARWMRQLIEAGWTLRVERFYCRPSVT